ncbi:hypothetical protein DPMN_084175 [Dreissena polymorpha]|uniref:Uncharacterized protein n=1 Tax=Dreissena polymorpha TaxID=45954 RepID=A0A9D4BJ48_DREPO|nr:hypothetical protein DPMN_084175 [Dreissena polymorpha]
MNKIVVKAITVVIVAAAPTVVQLNQHRSIVIVAAAAVAVISFQKYEIIVKADKLHFYHDSKTQRQSQRWQHETFCVVMEMVIAPPLAHKRHKRSLHLDTHTIWRKSPDSHTFSDDELFGKLVQL